MSHRSNRRNDSVQRRRRQPHRNPDIHQCLVCRRYHPLKFWRTFLNMDVRRRRRLGETKLYCLNCLARSHTIRTCTSLETCKRCNAPHHTLLHVSQQRNNRTQGLTTQDLRRRRSSASNQQQQQTIPNTKFLSEAIRSLAQVLCVSDAPN